MDKNSLPAHLHGMLDINEKPAAMPNANGSLASKILAHRDALNEEMKGEFYIDPDEYDPKKHDSRGDVEQARRSQKPKRPDSRPVKQPVKKTPPKAKPAPVQPQAKEKKMEDLDSVMNKAEKHLQAQAEPEQQEEQVTVDQWLKMKAMEILARRGTENPEEALATLKERHGAIYITIFDDDHLYIYTAVRRSKWKQIQSYITQLQENNTKEGRALEEELTRTVVRNCMVYPSLADVERAESFFQTSPAGVLDSLFQAVQQVSYFWSPQQVMAQTVRI